MYSFRVLGMHGPPSKSMYNYQPGKLTRAWIPQSLLGFHYTGMIDWTTGHMIKLISSPPLPRGQADLMQLRP